MLKWSDLAKVRAKKVKWYFSNRARYKVTGSGVVSTTAAHLLTLDKVQETLRELFLVKRESEGYYEKIQEMRYALKEAKNIILAANIDAPEVLKLITITLDE